MRTEMSKATRNCARIELMVLTRGDGELVGEKLHLERTHCGIDSCDLVSSHFYCNSAKFARQNNDQQQHKKLESSQERS